MTVLVYYDMPLFTYLRRNVRKRAMITLWPAAAGQSTALRVCISGRPETQLVTSWLRVGLVIPCFSWLYLDNHETISYLKRKAGCRRAGRQRATPSSMAKARPSVRCTRLSPMPSRLIYMLATVLHARRRRSCSLLGWTSEAWAMTSTVLSVPLHARWHKTGRSSSYHRVVKAWTNIRG